MGRRGKKGLSEDDREIWARVARTARPLSPAKTVRAKPRVEPAAPKPKDRPNPPPEPIAPFRIGAHARPSETAPPPAPHAPVRMDTGAHRKMIRGKLKPEARIDLHGMTLARAHPALTRFIVDAYDRDLRLVLVITGKGRDRDEGGPIPIRRGVLRQQVPHWLRAPPLGALVLEITEAHARHGGGGAYYVYLRRRR